MILPLGAVSLSPRAFKALGIEEIAYVKPVFESTGSTYEIHAADGTRLDCARLNAERGRRSVGLAAAYWDSRASGRVISSRRKLT
jgi:hypothetical protein